MSAATVTPPTTTHRPRAGRVGAVHCHRYFVIVELSGFKISINAAKNMTLVHLALIQKVVKL